MGADQQRSAIAVGQLMNLHNTSSGDIPEHILIVYNAAKHEHITALLCRLICNLQSTPHA